MIKEVIARVIDLIDQKLNSSSESCSSPIKSQLIDTRNNLNRLLEPNFSNDDWTRLFCRQLKRFVDSNGILTENSWSEIHSGILCILQRSSNNENESNNWKNFCKLMQLEAKLEQREIKFQETFGKQKSLYELYWQHKDFLHKYLVKCISLHSTIEINSMVENIDDFLQNVYGLTDVFLNSKTRKNLEKNLNTIKIMFDCRDRLLQNLDESYSQYDNLDKRINTTLDNFFPSTKQLPFRELDNPRDINMALHYNRWIVILADPGSAKTTLLRWVTHIFAQESLDYYRKINWQRFTEISIRVRIPILIRIGEFAVWLAQYPSKTLIDYIGKHTWFSQIYCDQDYENVLKEFVYHGHALILLDGLDEIADVGRRGEIVVHVQKFIDEYTRTSNFLSVLDDGLIETYPYSNLSRIVFHIGYAANDTANQIVITSRIIGYQLNSIYRHNIEHYALLSLKGNQVKNFIDQWIFQVNQHVLEVLREQSLHTDRKSEESLLIKRSNAIKTMIEKSSDSFLFNPSLLSLMCSCIFQSSSDEFNCKSRIELYHYTVQSTLRSWIKQKPHISANTLLNFLIDLATYLQSQSSSGLIDAFDIEHLCYSTLKKSRLFNDRSKIRNYAKELISLLDSNVGIIAERGLQVFAFQHSTFQEYFVAQSIITKPSIEHILKHFLLLITNSRFREPLLLALEWISWKWSFDDYDHFCNLLVTSTEDYVIPFGTLLFFDNLDNLQKFPSNSIIYTALNILFDHSSELIPTIYLIPNLFRLSKNILVQWIQLYINDEQSILKFCQYILTNIVKSEDTRNNFDVKLIPAVVYQQLWSMHSINTSVHFIIDQTLRKIASINHFTDDVFNNRLCSYESLADIFLDNIHPLILSVVIALCGGIHFEVIENRSQIRFSSKYMHRSSTILGPIIDYLNNNKNETHSVKIQSLIKQYESMLENVLLNDISVDVIDTFIALICLQGVSQPLIYRKYFDYQALPMAMERLKQVWFYLNKLFEHLSHSYNNANITLMESEIETIINVFFSQTNQSDEQKIVFTLLSAAAWKKLGMKSTSNWFNFDILRSRNIDQYLECQPEFIHSDNERKIEQMTKNSHPLQIFRHESLFLLTFLPQYLQPLYHYIIISTDNDTISSPIVTVILLSHCLIYLNDIDPYNINLYLAVLMLLPLCEEYMLQNYALVLFATGKSSIYINEYRDKFFRVMKDCNVYNEDKDWQQLINMERQRLYQAKHHMENPQKDLCMFAASISIARLCKEVRFSKNSLINDHSLFVVETEEVCSAIMNIHNPILRIIALSVVLDNGLLFINDEEQKDQLTLEMLNQLECVLPHSSLTISTLLYVRCHKVGQTCMEYFQRITHVLGQKFNGTSMDTSVEEQEVVFIALLYLNNINLLQYISDYARRMKNMSDLLQFNSPIFLEYFTNRTSFDSSNHVLLALFYLTELSFDVQNFKIYTCNSNMHTNIISPLEKLNQMWRNLSDYKNIMTYEIANWITNNIHLVEKNELDQIIKEICRCMEVKKNAFSVIKTWLDYRTTKDFRFLAYYAVLQMITQNFDVPDLSTVIKEILTNDTNFNFRNIIGNMFHVSLINSITIRQILKALYENIRYYTQLSISIHSKETFELILTLEFERISCETAKKSTRPYLLMIGSYNKDLEMFLKEYLLKCLESGDQIKERHVAIIIKWIIEIPFITFFDVKQYSTEFSEWIFTYLHHQQYPQVRKAVANGLDSVYLYHFLPNNRNFYFRENIFNQIEKVISYWNRYPDNILSICLLAYANYIIKLQQYKKNPNISEKIQNILMTIFQTSSSEIISIRAACCLIFANHSYLNYLTILDWFESKKNLTIYQKYDIISQLTLYSIWNLLSFYDTDIITQLIDVFVVDLYNYLSEKENIDYLADPIPKYINIALNYCERNADVFRHAIENSTFITYEIFQKEYCSYFYQINNPTDRAVLIKLYTVYNGITDDIIGMIKWINFIENSNGWKYLDHIKQVYDRDVIDSIFECLDSISYNEESQNVFSLLKLIVRFAEAGIISVLEVHQHILPIIKHITSKNNHAKWNDEKEIFDLLLNLSSIQKKSIPSRKETLFTESDIDQKFKDVYRSLAYETPLHLRRNYFLMNFRSTMTNST